MFGGRRWQERGQLAVMDAVVFFSAAIIISSMMLSFAARQPDIREPVGLSWPEDQLLDCVLSSSVSEDVTVSAPDPVHIQRSAPLRDCLAFEGEWLFRGGEPDAFEQLNMLISEKLRALAPRSADLHLLLVYKSYSEPLLSLPNPPQASDDRGASSSELTLADGTQLMVVLVLCPSSPSEFLEAGSADLDLLFGQLLASGHVEI